MCLAVLVSTYFRYDVVLNDMAGSLSNEHVVESAYLQPDCFELVTVCKMICQSWILWNDIDWHCLVHIWDLHVIGVPLGFSDYSYGALECSSGNIDWRSGHTCCIPYTDIS